MSQIPTLDELMQASEPQLSPPSMPIAAWRPPLPDPVDPNFALPAKMAAQAECGSPGASPSQQATSQRTARRAPRSAKKRTRLTATPDFSPFVSENEPHSTGGALIPVDAGAAQVAGAVEVRASEVDELGAAGILADEGAGEQESQNRVNRTQVSVSERVPDEVRQLLVRIGVNLHTAAPGRKHVLDEFMRGRLVSLLAMGLTLRQAASALGLSHVAIWKELKKNAGLSEEVNAARFQAQIEPLLVILRESKRSWRAATWLINYLSKSLAASEETLDERGLYAKERSQERARFIAEDFAMQSKEIDEARKRMREKTK